METEHKSEQHGLVKGVPGYGRGSWNYMIFKAHI